MTENAAAPIAVHVFPHPLEDDCETFEEPGGRTIAEILGRTDLPAVVFADGEVIEPEEWATFRPERALVVRRVPEGNAGRILATLAVVTFAAWAGAAVAGTLGALGHVEGEVG